MPDCAGAAEWTRTTDPVLTKDVLYRLSYGSSWIVRLRHHIGSGASAAYVATMAEKASERGPRLSAQGERARAERIARLAAAMRANLKKRKAQKQAREEARRRPGEGR